MTDLPTTVEIREEGPREGFQIEPGPIPADRKVALIEALAATGLRQIQLCSFVSPKLVPGWADAEAVVAAVAPPPGVAFTALWFNDKGLARALAFRDKLKLYGSISFAASEAFSRKNLNRDRAGQIEAMRALTRMHQDAGVPVLDPQAEWLVVGWGAHSFFATVGSPSDITASTLWRSATGDASVLRIDVAGRIDDFSRITLLALTPVQFGALTDAILDSFAQMDDGGRIPLPYPGFTPTDGFFAGRDRFHALRTCNVWVSDMLARADVRFGRWTPTNYAVRLAFWRFVPRN
jgi:uncharacterized protein (TIGR02117 family)